MTAQPIWFSPRDGFTARCIAYFGADFNHPVDEDVIPRQSRAHVFPTTSEANRQRNRKISHVKHQGTRLAHAAMQGASLLQRRKG